MINDVKKAIWEDLFLSVVYTDEDGITSIREIAVFTLGFFKNGNEAIRVHDGEGWKTFLIKRMHVIGFSGSYDPREIKYSQYKTGRELRFTAVMCWKNLYKVKKVKLGINDLQKFM